MVMSVIVPVEAAAASVLAAADEAAADVAAAVVEAASIGPIGAAESALAGTAAMARAATAAVRKNMFVAFLFLDIIYETGYIEAWVTSGEPCRDEFRLRLGNAHSC